MRRADSFEKTVMLRKIEGRRRSGQQRMRWWMASLTFGHGFEWTPGVGNGQGVLVCCGSGGHKELDTIEWLNWTELNWTEWIVYSIVFRKYSKWYIKHISDHFLYHLVLVKNTNPEICLHLLYLSWSVHNNHTHHESTAFSVLQRDAHCLERRLDSFIRYFAFHSWKKKSQSPFQSNIKWENQHLPLCKNSKGILLQIIYFQILNAVQYA